MLSVLCCARPKSAHVDISSTLVAQNCHEDHGVLRPPCKKVCIVSQLISIDGCVDLEDVSFELAINGEVRQSGHVNQMIFDIPSQLRSAALKMEMWSLMES